MKYKDELQIMKQLGIDSWRNLSKDKIIKFSAMMPDMDKEVMMKIIDKFPEFRLFAKDVLNNFEATYKSTLDANNENQKDIHNMFNDLRRILEDQLNKEEISFEEKKYYIDKLFECRDKEIQHDIINKKFLLDMAKNVVIIAGGTLLAAIVFIGGKALINQNNSNNNYLDNDNDNDNDYE